MSEGVDDEGNEEAFSRARFSPASRILVSVASFRWITPIVLGTLVEEEVRG